MVGKQPIVLLKTADSNKFLPIWIGHPEAAAILMRLQGASTPRPMTHDLMVDVLGELEVKCVQVAVTELRDNTFFASITLAVNGREIEVDSRPSDALALAVRAGAPIFAAEEVIAESAIEFEHEVEDTEQVVDRFKEFLDEVTPGGLRLAILVQSARQAPAPAPARAPTNASNPTPAASAASGSRLVSVSPGIAFASSTWSSPLSRSSSRSTRAKPSSPSARVDRSASSWALGRDARRPARPGSGSSCARSCSAPRSRRSPPRAAPPRRPAAPRRRAPRPRARGRARSARRAPSPSS